MSQIPLPVRLNEAKALSDEVRVFILDLLTKRPMSVQEIYEELKKRGMLKSINAIRYHLSVLKDSGLIELVRTEEVKGGVLKYYASKRKVYAFEVPKDLEEKISVIVNELTKGLKLLVISIISKYRDVLVREAIKLKPCPYCITRHFVEYLLVESYRLALAKVIGDKDVRNLLNTLEEKVEEIIK